MNAALTAHILNFGVSVPRWTTEEDTGRGVLEGLSKHPPGGFPWSWRLLTHAGTVLSLYSCLWTLIFPPVVCEGRGPIFSFV